MRGGRGKLFHPILSRRLMTFTVERFILGVCCGDARETAGLKLPPSDTAGDAGDAACFSSQFHSVQFKMVSIRPEKPICAPHRLRSISNVAFETSRGRGTLLGISTTRSFNSSFFLSSFLFFHLCLTLMEMTPLPVSTLRLHLGLPCGFPVCRSRLCCPCQRCGCVEDTSRVFPGLLEPSLLPVPLLWLRLGLSCGFSVSVGRAVFAAELWLRSAILM